MNTILDLAIVAAKFLVGAWPVMFVVLLIGIAKRQKGFGAVLRSSTLALIVTWGLFAIAKMVFYLMEMETFHLITEPLDTRLFLGLGILLFPFMVAILLEERRKKYTASTLEELRSLSPADFEEMVADTYRAQGHDVEVVGGSGDHGIDLIVRSQRGEIWLVQCKRYSGKVGEPVVRDLYGALRASDANGAALITTGYITEAARLWAEGKPLHLFDGNQFLKIVLATRARNKLPEQTKNLRPKNERVEAAPRFVVPAAMTSRSAAASVEPVTRTSSMSSEPVTDSVEEVEDKRPFSVMNEAPDCPACGVEMVLHTQKHLFRKPTYTYICSNAPDCTETYPVE
ncbi:MAG: restriction endonuclease [Anaerolineaceae bacterium]|nr:restriction endonuclease [Anaerolineaceae bacterium]